MIPTRYINPGPIGPKADAGPALQAAGAQVQVGKALESLGESGLEVIGRLRRAEEGGKIGAFMANAEAEADKFSQTLATRPDTDGWIQEWKDQQATFLKDARALGLSPEGEANLAARLDAWNIRRSTTFETQANVKKLGIARAQSSQSRQFLKARGDAAGFEDQLATDLAANLISPEQAEMERNEFKVGEASMDLQQQAETNPRALVDESPEDILKRMPFATPEMVKQAKGVARLQIEVKRQEEISTIEERQNGGRPVTPQDLEAAQYLTPKDVASFKKGMKRTSPPTAEEHAKAWDLILKNRGRFYDQSLDDAAYSSEWNSLRTELMGIIPAPFRADVSRELDARSPARRQMDRKKAPRVKNTLLEDLESISLARISRARESGQFGSISEDASPEDREAAFRKSEDLRIKTVQYFAEHPDAKEKEALEWVDGLISGDRAATSAGTAQGYVPGFTRPQPMTLPGISARSGQRPVAGSAGDRITSYGYPGDPTPDSNSSAGIGAWVNSDEAARIRAGENTPNKLRKNDFAVSPDVEKRFRDAGISEGDQVVLQLSDGTSITGRWMDRTAEEWKGKKLTGRFDLYSPDGPSPLDGKSVQSWAGVSIHRDAAPLTPAEKLRAFLNR